MDWNRDGRLGRRELRAMMESDAFECDYEDVGEVGGGALGIGLDGWMVGLGLGWVGWLV